MSHANRSKRGDNPARNPTPEEVGAKRKARGWTPAEAAKIAFLTGQFWEDVESGKKRMHPATWQYWLLMTDGELGQARKIMRELLEFSFPPAGGGPSSDAYLTKKHEEAKQAALDWLYRTGGVQ